MITVNTFANTTRLTTVANFNELTGVSGDDTLVGKTIDRATAAILKHCQREFARQNYTELAPGYGTIFQMLTNMPVLILGTVTFNSQSITDVLIDDKEAGTLYRDAGFMDTAAVISSLSPIVLPEHHPRKWSFTYDAGYLLPGDDMAVKTIAASDTDDSFNDSGSGFPLLLAGDRIVVAGFTESANNGTFTVVSRTAAKVVIDGSLTTEVAGDDVTIGMMTLPDDVEEACLVTTRDWYRSRKGGQDVKTKKVGDLSLTYSDKGVGKLPDEAIGLLENWVKVV